MKDRLLECDVVEIVELLHMTPFEAMMSAFKRSKMCSTVENNGLPILIFGVVPSPEPGVATGWMLVSKEIEQMRLTFLRHSRQVIWAMLKEYPLIYNFVAVKHEKVIRWLRWCGARIGAPTPRGPKGELFSLFILERDHVHA